MRKMICMCRGNMRSSKDTGQLSIATTHTHACYTLPRVIQQFSAAYPRVQQKRS